MTLSISFPHLFMTKQMCQRKTKIPLLRNLPKYTSSSQFGFNLCSDNLSSSPAAIPLLGSGLTKSQLSTPVGSPPSSQAEGKRQTIGESRKYSQIRIENNLWKDSQVYYSSDESENCYHYKETLEVYMLLVIPKGIILFASPLSMPT